MRHLIQTLERFGIGHRPLTIDDYWHFTAIDDIETVWSVKRYAFYFSIPAYDIKGIVLPEHLQGTELLYVMFHELAHHWLHGGDDPSIAFYGNGDKKAEAEADAVALLALIPRITPEAYAEFQGTWLWQKRYDLYLIYSL